MEAITSEQHLFMLMNLKKWIEDHPDEKNEIQKQIRYDLTEYLDREICNHKEDLDKELLLYKQVLIEQRRNRFINRFFDEFENIYSDEQKETIISILKENDFSKEQVLKFANPKYEPWKIEFASDCVKDNFTDEQWKICFESKHDIDKVYYLSQILKNGVDESVFRKFLSSRFPEAIIGLYLIGQRRNIDKERLYEDLLSTTYYKRDLMSFRKDVEYWTMYRRSPTYTYEQCISKLMRILSKNYVSLENTLIAAKAKRDKQSIDVSKKENSEQYR